MTAYIIVDSHVTDPERYERYKELTPAAVARYGGRFVVRGGATQVLEGTWQPARVVLLEFPDMAAALAFYESPEYREARQARQGAADMNMVAVEGV